MSICLNTGMDTKTCECNMCCMQPGREDPFCASLNTAGSVFRLESQIASIEEKVDRLRDAAYRAKRYGLSARLQDVKRALYKIRVEFRSDTQTRTNGQ